MPAEIEDETGAFLDTQRVARLATAGADRAPHVVPVVFARRGPRVYIAIDEKPKTTTRLRRLRNIEENPRAALIADVYDEDWGGLRWVMLRGAAAVLTEGPEHAAAIAALRAKYPQYRGMALEGRPIIRLRAERVTAWRAAEGSAFA